MIRSDAYDVLQFSRQELGLTKLDSAPPVQLVASIPPGVPIFSRVGSFSARVTASVAERSQVGIGLFNAARGSVALIWFRVALPAATDTFNARIGTALSGFTTVGVPAYGDQRSGSSNLFVGTDTAVVATGGNPMFGGNVDHGAPADQYGPEFGPVILPVETTSLAVHMIIQTGADNKNLRVVGRFDVRLARS